MIVYSRKCEKVMWNEQEREMSRERGLGKVSDTKMTMGEDEVNAVRMPVPLVTVT